MGIRTRNIDPRSSKRVYDLQFLSSAVSAGVAINVGIVPAPCRFKEVYVGSTASSIASNVIVLLNNANGISAVIPAFTASGGSQRVVGPASPRLITAGTLITVALSSTAAIAQSAYLLRFELGKEGK